jgi:hypothetical protein
MNPLVEMDSFMIFKNSAAFRKKKTGIFGSSYNTTSLFKVAICNK